VKNDGTERPGQHFDDLAVAIDTPLVQLCVVLKIRFRERREGDVRLPADAVASLKDPRPLARLDVRRLALQRRLRRGAVVSTVQPESVGPMMVAMRRGGTV